MNSTGNRFANDRQLKGLPLAEPGKRYDAFDESEPGLGVRISSSSKTFFYIARFPGSANPTRRSIGPYNGGDHDPVTGADRRRGKVTLAQAREKAKEWAKLLRQEIDPRQHEQALRDAEQRRRDTTFRGVAEDFIRLKVNGASPEDKAAVVERDLRREYIEDFTRPNGSIRKGLGAFPIDSIEPRHIIGVVDDAVERGAIYQAHNLLGHVRRLFNWAIARGVYGVERSPCDRMRPATVIGAAKKPRDRILNDDEIFALWRGADRMGYPFGTFYKLLTLTGQRKTQVSEARWSEFDLQRGLWTIPAERMKTDHAHVVPLTEDVLALLQTIPRFAKKKRDPNPRDLLFSTTRGEKPISGYSKAKARLDQRMRRTLRALARRRGKEPEDFALKEFVNHDIRRTVRTGLSALGVADRIAEKILAHRDKGIVAVYDLHSYEAEKRDALERWASRLRGIVAPARDNVVTLQRSIAARDGGG